MAGKGIAAQRDELVEEQLRGIKEALGELKASVALVSANLDAVRIAELSSIRSNVNDVRIAYQAELAKRDSEIARHDSEIKLLRYQMGRTSAVWSLVSGGVASAIVAAVMALVLRH